MRIFGSLCPVAATAAVLSILGHTATALSAAEWRKQAIYQVMTDRFARTDLSTTARCDTGEQVYCGGTWRGLISKLDYIQGMGFTAVWISPVVKQVDGVTRDGSSYHGYWARDIWSLNPAFGSPADLIALSAALHARGMYLMVDVVTNHMAYVGCRSCVDYSIFNPFSNPSYFHPPCGINYNSQTSVEVCWQGSDTVSLPDLRTEDENVRRIWNDWISNLVSTYSIDGVRIDSAKHVEPSFYSGFNSAAGVFTMGEVYHGDPAYLAPYQRYMDGVLDYASVYWITRAFQSPSGSISNLVSGLTLLRDLALDLSLYGSFLENHDLERFPSLTKDKAIAFMMLKDGIPIIYQGQEHHYAGGKAPYNREALWFSGYSNTSDLYTWIARLNQIRTRAISQDSSGYLSYSSQIIQSDSRTVTMRKGFPGYQIISVFTNAGSSSSPITLSLPSSATGFTASQSLVDVMSCTALTTDSNGNIVVTLNGGLPKVLYPSARLSNSRICPSLTRPTTTTTTTRTMTTTASSTDAPTATTSPSCPFVTVSVTFNGQIRTSFGETVKIVGNHPLLGNWSPANGIPLDASKYTNSNPLWYGTVDKLEPSTVIQYKFVKVSNSGTVTWEGDPNHRFTVPCAATATASSSWQGY
ncbi:Glycoside hydrolase superfamily [Naviculisporaceae sp. PSN 640]